MTQSEKRPRASRLDWVRIGAMRTSPKAQREFRKAHAEMIAADFQFEGLGFPVVSHRDGYYWILDGQHRIAALKLSGFADDDLIQCEVYTGLTEAEEADLFLVRDQRKAINKFDAFRIAVTAGHQKECHIEKIVQYHGCKISKSQSAGCIGATEALKFSYGLGSLVLGRTIRILHDAYDGDRAAFDSGLVRGMSLVCQRYNGTLEDDQAVEKLSHLVGGPAAIRRRADALALKTGHTKTHCTAAAIVDTLNAGRGGAKLDSWWK